jgi:hypothetical protein
MLDHGDLGPADEALLDLLRDGRVTAPFAADETGYSLQYVRDRLTRLVEHGNAVKVYEGLYELVEDPRDTETNEMDQTRQDSEVPTDDLRERMESTLAGLEVPGRPAAVERTRREAIKYAWDRLREVGEMPPSRLADDVMGKFFENDDLGYSVSSQHPGYQLLDNVLRDTVRELPGVHSTGRVWQFREESR